MDQLPVVTARLRTTGTVQVDCPFCHKTHIHGIGGLPGPRLSHCVSGDVRDEYQVVLPASAVLAA